MHTVDQKKVMYFYSFIVAQAVIDIATGVLTTYTQMMITPGSIIRVVLLLLAVPYIWKQLRGNSKMKIAFSSALISVFITASLSFFMKEPFFINQEAVFYMKTLYYVVSIFFMLVYMRKPLLSGKQLERAILVTSSIISGSYFVALFTRTNFPSYPGEEMGSAGWFFSANELSVIVILLVAALLTITRMRPSIVSFMALVSLAGVSMFIGTKTAYIGVAIVLFVSCVELLWTYKTRMFKQRLVWIYGGLLIAFVSALPFLPMTENRMLHMETPSTSSETIRTEPINNLLSSRDAFASDRATDFSQASIVRKWFGLGYAGDYNEHPKMIEMDFLELFFSFGYIGTVVLILPLSIYFFHICSRRRIQATTLCLITGFGLTIAIAAVAGHVLFAPSVMSYVVICAALLQPKKHVNRRMEKIKSGKDGYCEGALDLQTPKYR